MDQQNDKLDKLTKLLEKALKIYEEDRALSIKNYNKFREQLDNILSQEFEMSQEGRLEAEVNKALKHVFDSGQRLDNVINAVKNILVNQMHSESREKIAKEIFGNGRLGGPADIRQLLENR